MCALRDQYLDISCLYGISTLGSANQNLDNLHKYRGMVQCALQQKQWFPGSQAEQNPLKTPVKHGKKFYGLPSSRYTSIQRGSPSSNIGRWDASAQAIRWDVSYEAILSMSGSGTLFKSWPKSRYDQQIRLSGVPQYGISTELGLELVTPNHQFHTVNNSMNNNITYLPSV